MRSGVFILTACISSQIRPRTALIGIIYGAGESGVYEGHVKVGQLGGRGMSEIVKKITGCGWHWDIVKNLTVITSPGYQFECVGL